MSRRIFLLLCLGCVIIVASNGQWEGQLRLRNHCFILDLKRSPVWAPPELPTYSQFLVAFKGSEDFPDENSGNYTIRRVMKVEWMLNDLTLYLWPVTVVAGLFYTADKQGKRDFILHQATATGCSLTIGGILCVVVWLVIGGWGPPLPVVYLGLVVGLTVGFTTYFPISGKSGR
ncbi:MAG: hypothetical protein R3B84_23855 [Zavarzinella sp.]